MTDFIMGHQHVSPHHNTIPLTCNAMADVLSLSKTSPGFYVSAVYFRLSPRQMHVRKVVGGFGKKSCIRTDVRKPLETHMHHRPP